MKKNETMRGLCLLLAMVMVLSLMPMSVLATDGTDSDIPEWYTNTVVYINGQDVTTIDEGDDTISWDAETKTLTLNNASILAENGTHKGSGIYVLGADTVVLELKGENTVEGKFNGRIDNYQYVDDIFANAAISTVGNLIIRGEGTLNATDLDVETLPDRSAGIYAGGGLTIEGGTINATGGATSTNSTDLYSSGIISGDYSSWGTMRITGGTVNATGGTFGITTYTTLIISGGTVNAIANSETGNSGIFTPDQMGGFEYGGVHFSGGTTTMSGPDRAVTGLTNFQNFGVYKWTDTPDGAYQYSGLDLFSGMTAQYLRIEPAEYSFVDPSSSNRYTADVQFNDGEAWGPLPENVTAEYKWYRYNERFLTDQDFDESTAFYVTYDDTTGLWTAPLFEADPIAAGMMGVPAQVGQILTITVPQKPSGFFIVVSLNSEKMFEERSNGVFTHTVTEADLEPESGLLVLELVGMDAFQYTLSLADTEEVQTAADKPNRFISDVAGKYMCSATVYQDGVQLGTFTSAPFAYTYTGWKEIKDEGGNVLGTQYILNHEAQYTGWTEIGGDWYYLDPTTGYRAEGIVRVPYPTEAINGVTYAPNAEDIAYYENKGQTFIDKDTALFVFDENGVFQRNFTGMTADNRWAVNGHIAWHAGLVQIGEDYYYFIGDVDNGGNKLATGDVYVSRNTTEFDMVVGGVYTFGTDGKLYKYEGITELNGVLRYYENYRLMLGNGLTKVGENCIYVNSDGELIVDAEYYVPGNDLGIASGTYYFDENGYLVNPVSTDKDGIYFENGAWYYYESGKKQYGLGLIGVSKYWYYPDGTRSGASATIYVRSNGQLAIGEYYVTNVDNYEFGDVASGTKLIFSEVGKRYAPKNGIREVDGNLYYFVNDQIQYNAGLIEHNGGWIYVRSNGKLATGAYWITNTNGNLDAGMYEFGEDGYLVISDTEDGIVDENGILYYYEEGKKLYGVGLKQLSDDSYIYIRTNGELAVGSYWITNHNGLLPEDLYEFDANGILIEN